jgi:hypothetical protein
MRATRAIVVAGLATALIPATAVAGTYPPAGNPGSGKKVRKGKAKTFVVSKKKGSKYKTISAAVKKAQGGDLIKVGNGTYREGVKVSGPGYDGLRIVGNKKSPGKVVIDSTKVKGSAAQNGIQVNNADGVELAGIKAQGYRANGFFLVNVDGYDVNHVIAAGTGVYGVYAFNSKGGTISDSTAYDNNDSGFYIGQTPKQAKPKRSLVTRVTSYRNVLGYSGTNMRYVTITKSKWFNNGTGIVPNALKSEKFPPPQENVIANNDVFWNNYNYFAGAKFKIPTTGPSGLAGYPIGVGVLLFGSQSTTVEKNRIYGNWLAGFGEIPQVTLAGEKDPKLKEASILRDNTVRNNVFGKGGSDLNARDMVYDGSGTGNCFSGNTVTSPNVPASNSVFAACPGPKQNTPDGAALAQAIGWVATVDPKKPDTFEAYWIRHPHAATGKLKPLVRTSK